MEINSQGHLIASSEVIAAVASKEEPGLVEGLVIGADEAWLVLVSAYEPGHKVPFENVRDRLFQEVKNRSLADVKIALITSSKAKVQVRRLDVDLPSRPSNPAPQLPSKTPR